jgi:small subunit ribosomal protein S9
MAEEPEQQETPEQPDTPEEQEAPAEENTAAEQDAAEAQDAAVPPEEALAEDAATEAEGVEDAATEAEGAEEQPQAEGDPEPEAVAESKPEAEEKGKGKSDLPPGAELDPIALEPERPLSAEEKARAEAEAEERERLEAAATAEAPEDATATTSRTPAQLAGDARYLATGKRKSSIARVTVMPGDGKFEINRRSLQEYFPRPLHQSTALQPLTVTGYEGTVDVRVNVQGGGIGGQAGAVRHGIARALTEIDPELRGELKRRGFLTRDARVKERRKAGLKKARKRPQFSKR